MSEKVLEFLKTKEVCTLAVQMLDGSPHAATVHFAYQAEPFTFVIFTNPKYRKAEPILKKDKVLASMVITNEEEPNQKTLQLDGEITTLKAEEYRTVYLERFPKTAEKHSNDFPFIFTPTWWRFTDWSSPGGKTVITSDGNTAVTPKH